MTKQAAIITRDGCKWCERAEEALKSRGYGVMMINYSQDNRFKDFLVASGFTTVPQIFLNGTHVGGYEDLVAKFNNKEIE